MVYLLMTTWKQTWRLKAACYENAIFFTLLLKLGMITDTNGEYQGTGKRSDCVLRNIQYHDTIKQNSRGPALYPLKHNWSSSMIHTPISGLSRWPLIAPNFQQFTPSHYFVGSYNNSIRYVRSPQNEECFQSLLSFLFQFSWKQSDFQETFSTSLRGF